MLRNSGSSVLIFMVLSILLNTGIAFGTDISGNFSENTTGTTERQATPKVFAFGKYCDYGIGFAVYDIGTDTWTALNDYESCAMMAVSTSNRIYAFRRSPAQIDVYDPLTDTWSYVMDGPPVDSNGWGNLEITATGEFFYTQRQIPTLFYTSAGVWNSTSLSFPPNMSGDYDPVNNQYVVGENLTPNAHLIDVNTLAVTDFVLGSGTTQENRTFAAVLGGRYYYHGDNDPIRSYDLSNPGLAGAVHGGAPPSDWIVNGTDRVNGLFYVHGEGGQSFNAFDPGTGSYSALTPYGGITYSGLVYVSDVDGIGAATSPFRISGGPATGHDLDGAIAYNPNRGEYLVVWSDARNQGERGYDTYAQRVGADGGLLGNNIRISGNAATGNEGQPFVAYDGRNGQYLIVWSDDRLQAIQGKDVWAQFLNGDGSKAGINFRVTGNAATGDDTQPSTAYNPTSNTFVVTWTDGRFPQTRGTDIWAQRVSGNRQKVDLNRRISGGQATGDDGASTIVFNSVQREFLVAFEASRGGRQSIYGRRLNANGERLALNFILSGTAGNEHQSPSLTYNRARNQYLVVWSDDRNAAARGWDIYAQKLTEEGIRDGQTFRVCGNRARGDDTSPSVAYSVPEDAYVVIWQDERDPDGRGNDIWGRILDGGGTPNADEMRPSGNGDTEDENLYPGAGALACSTGSGHVLGVWTDTFRESTRGWDVFGRVIEIEGPPEG